MPEKLPKKPYTPRWFYEYSKPTKPSKPQKSWKDTSWSNSELIYFGERDFRDLLDEIEAKYPRPEWTVAFSIDDICFIASKLETIVHDNPNYLADLARYEKDLAQYEERVVIWAEKTAELKAWNQDCKRIRDLNQLERLQKKYKP